MLRSVFHQVVSNSSSNSCGNQNLQLTVKFKIVGHFEVDLDGGQLVAKLK